MGQRREREQRVGRGRGFGWRGMVGGREQGQARVGVEVACIGPGCRIDKASSSCAASDLVEAQPILLKLISQDHRTRCMAGIWLFTQTHTHTYTHF